MQDSFFKKSMLTVLSIFMVLFCVLPFVWTILTSFKRGSELFNTQFLPNEWSLENYISVFQEQPFYQNILNSIYTAGLTVVISSMLALLCSYAIARIRFRGRTLLLFSVLSVSMFPQIAILSGLFEIIQKLGLYNSIGALVVSYMIFTLPFTIWVLTTFMRDVPKALEEAAIMDGASSLGIVFKVFLPILAPAFFTTGILSFIAAWNEFLFALTFTMSDESRTVPVAIGLISGASQYELPWGNIMAASVIVTLPLIFLVLVFQKRIVSGLTAGSVKG